MWEMLITFNKICLVLTYNAEWCAASGEKKGEMGGGLAPRTSPRPARDGSPVERCGIPRIVTSRRDDTISVVPAGHCFAPEGASGPHRTHRPYQAFVPDGTRGDCDLRFYHRQ